MSHRLPLFFLALASLALFAACDSGDPGGDGGDDDPVMFNVEIANVDDANPVLKSGVAVSPGGPDSGPALFAGETATFSFTAPANTVPESGMRLNLATMFVQSNDLFYAFAPEGLALFDSTGAPITGDVTDQIFLYDAGTEVDTAPGTGPDQKPAQDPTAVDQGEDEDELVQLIDDAETNDFDYPSKTDVIQVTIEHDGGTQFTVSVTNVSEPGTIDSDRAMGTVPLSPFAWAVHTDGYTMYEVGEEASTGIELIAEDGFPAGMIGETDLPPESGLADAIAEVTGVTVPLSPGGYAVHSGAFQLFTVGQAAGDVIEAIAEDGNNEPFGSTIPGADGVASAGTFGPPPQGPGGSFTFDIEAEPGDRLSFATMYVQSNDIYYAFAPEGLALFDADGTPVSGDVTAQVVLYDAGTEVDEEPGVGLNQVIRQGELDTGEEEDGSVVSIGDGGMDSGFTYPPNAQVIQVTVTPL